MDAISCMPHYTDIDFWINNNLNVLFYGRHGVGKTSIIIDAFKRHNLQYMMFSASTMDPWVDFIGVPKEQKDEAGSYLEIVPPKAFRDDTVQALFFDELNRSHKKIRNAIMELIQFKSINGRHFKNLRFVWGAVNPDSDDALVYDVEKLDPAQSDRFQVHLEIPYKPSAIYFREKFGRQMADAAIDWWHELPKNLQNEVSPRRLEYALEIFKKDGNINFVLPPHTNTNKLAHALLEGSPLRVYKELIKNNDKTKLKEWLTNENNFFAVSELIAEKPDDTLSLLSDEKICMMVSRYHSVRHYVLNSNEQQYVRILKDIAENSTNNSLKSEANKYLVLKNIDAYIEQGNKLFNSPVPAVYSTNNYKIEKYYRFHDELKIQQTTNFAKTNKIGSRAVGYASLHESVAFLLTEGENTDVRIKSARTVSKIVEIKGDALESQEALLCIDIINEVCARTQKGTLKNRIPNICSIIARCVRVLRNKKIFTQVKDFVDRCPHICGLLYYVPINTDDYGAIFAHK